MEKSGLCPELQSFIDRFVNFRIEYTTLKTHYNAQDELMKLQKIELDKSNVRLEKLSTTFIEWQKCCNIKLHNLKSENEKLQKIIDNLRDQGEGALTHQARRHTEAKISDLEAELTKLRSRIVEVNEKHREQIESMKKSHEEEIFEYKKKLEHCNVIEQRQSNEIAIYKKKELEENKNELQNLQSQINNLAVHPALEDNVKEGHKRKNSNVFKWPELDFDLKKDIANHQQGTSRLKKKKLYNIDNEIIVDLSS